MEQSRRFPLPRLLTRKLRRFLLLILLFIAFISILNSFQAWEAASVEAQQRILHPVCEPSSLDIPKPPSSLDIPKPPSSLDIPKPPSSLDIPKPPSSLDIPKPPSSLDIPKPPSSLDIPKPPSSLDIPKPPSSLDIPKPPSSLDIPKPPSSLDIPKPPSSLDSTKPPSPLDSTKPPSPLDIPKPPSPFDIPKPPSSIDSTKPPSSLDSTKPLSRFSISALHLNELYLDPAIDMTAKDDMKEILDTLPNLPFSYREKNEPDFGSVNNNCTKYPGLFDIHFNSIYWQVLQTSNGTFYLYSAFYDNRTLSKHKPSIRILGMINRIEPSVKTKCKMWFNDKNSPVIVNVSEYRYIWYQEWGNYKQGILQPYLLECIVPAEHRQLVPQSVSLVEQPCDKPTNNLRIINNQPADGQKKNFAVCVKGLDFYVDKTVRIVEWLELLFLLGADKVFLYNMALQPTIKKVLKYYESLGRVDVKKLSLPGEQPNERYLLHKYLINKGLHKRQNEVIPYNDCLYRNMYRYKYIILLDTDEVIIPKTAADWRSLLDQVAAGVKEARNLNRASFCARNVYFLDSMQAAHGYFYNIPPYMHLMQHVYRAANYTKPGHFVKCFHDTERVRTLHNHYPVSCLDSCNVLNLPTEYAHLQHYRKDCSSGLKKSCQYFKNHTVLDKTLWRYKEPLIRNTLYALRQLIFWK